MLHTLYISNYALIDKIEIEFSAGLNIVTGETGAGKSIVLGALSMLCGERADMKTIRDESRKTIIEARFDPDKPSNLRNVLEQHNIEVFDSECILRRELSAKGTTRAFINDTPVNLTVMKEVAQLLIDIHSQHENRLLTDPAFQVEILDGFAANSDIRERYNQEYRRYRRVLKDYNDFRANMKRAEAENDYNIHLLEQLDELDLQPGELQQLEQDREITANAAEIKTRLNGALDALTRGESNCLSLIGAASDELSRLTDFVSDASELHDRLKTAQIEIADIVETLNDYDASLAGDTRDLEWIEERLSKIYALQARHNVATDTELIERRHRLRSAISDVENADERLHDLEQQAKTAKRDLVEAARALSASRTEAAEKLGQLLVEKARPLGLGNLRCDIRVTPDKLKADGADNVQYLFAFNKNQPLMPLGKTASGGEISRLFLALKAVTVDMMHLPTVVFDEIDTGVSGQIANSMAQLMLNIAEMTQVITITHVPTVAAHGSRHFKIFKVDDENTTHTHIRLLTEEERLDEIAMMISGDASDAEARQTARTMIKHKS